jgi:carbonic anhydrase
MPEIGKLISGFNIFKATSFARQKDVIEHLLHQGVKPSTMIISCADIRMAPAEIFATNPGDLYIISNIGGLVPKFESNGIHGILSAIEYAVTVIEVQNIIILGHARCDGIKMMMNDNFHTADGGRVSESMKTWLAVASEARSAVKKDLVGKTQTEQYRACEHESLIVSLRNLIAYPYVAKRIKEKKLNVFAWHFNAEEGDILSFNPDTKFFEPLT